MKRFLSLLLLILLGNGCPPLFAVSDINSDFRPCPDKVRN